MEGYKNYWWIVADPDLLGGRLAVRGTRLSVSFPLACLAEGMSAEEIQAIYGTFPREALAEILNLAASQFDQPVAAA